MDNKKITANILNGKEVKGTTTKKKWWLISGGILLLISGLFWFFRKMNKEQTATHPVEKIVDSLSAEQVLAPVSLLIKADDKTFYSSLRQSIWDYFSFHFNFSGSEMSKENIAAKLKESNTDEKLITEVKDILQYCEAGIFTSANLAGDKNLLLDKVKEVLENLNKSLL
jgi:hypothetical protein